MMQMTDTHKCTHVHGQYFCAMIYREILSIVRGVKRKLIREIFIRFLLRPPYMYVVDCLVSVQLWRHLFSASGKANNQLAPFLSHRQRILRYFQVFINFLLLTKSVWFVRFIIIIFAIVNDILMLHRILISHMLDKSQGISSLTCIIAAMIC